MHLLSGKAERLPYSLSRWTDLPVSKWDWFKAQLEQGYFVGFDPRSAVPARWSLAASDILGLIFWTKNPENLIYDASLVMRHRFVVHMTLTGWEEVEKGAPSAAEGIKLMEYAAKVLGPENLTWRFSPVPLVDDVVDRFEALAARVSKLGIKEAYVAFLQENDLMPETRPRRSRVELLKRMAAKSHGIKVLLCNEDRSLQGESLMPENLGNGICEPGSRFVELPPIDPIFPVTSSMRQQMKLPPSEGCGCALAVDPFTINETCTMGCKYCYAADKSLADKKRNTTKFSLPMVT